MTTETKSTVTQLRRLAAINLWEMRKDRARRRNDMQEWHEGRYFGFRSSAFIVADVSDWPDPIWQEIRAGRFWKSVEALKGKAVA